MLVLRRNVGESILIDGGIRVVILGKERGRIAVGIEAPDHVRVMRAERVEGKQEDSGEGTKPLR